MVIADVEINGELVDYRISSININDSLGLASDSCSVIFPLPDVIEPPIVGMELKVYVSNEELGMYVISGYEVRKDTFNVLADSFDVTSNMRDKKNHEFKERNLFYILKTVLDRNGIDHVISDKLKKIRLGSPYIQIKQSDLNVITDLCKEYALFFKQRKKKMIIGRVSDEDKPAGGSLDILELKAEDLMNDWVFIKNDDLSYNSITVEYFDIEGGNVLTTTYGNGEPNLKVKGTNYNNELDAYNRAEAEYIKRQGKNEIFEFRVKKGNPLLHSERRVKFKSMAPYMDGVYKIVNATHTVSEKGYLTACRAVRLEKGFNDIGAI